MDFAPGELAEDQYEVTIVIPPEEGFMGVGAVDAVVEVALVGEEFDFYGPEDDSQPEELLEDYASDEDGAESDWARGEFEGSAEDMAGDKPAPTRLRFFLEKVLWEIGLTAQIKITEDSEQIRAEMTGEDLGILIGRRGQTLDALEYLAGIALFGRGAQRKHVDLDAEGYKDRRRRQVERVAVRKADEAARRGKAVQLTPMTPAERKIVHLALRDRTDVTTVSEGRDPNRAVVISPVR